MTWTRSAALRAGLTGAAGAAIVLSILPPPTPTATTQTSADDATVTLTLAAARLPIPEPVTVADVEAAETARDRQQASRGQAREELDEPPLPVDSPAEPAPAAQPPTTPAVVGEMFATSPLNVRDAPKGSVVTVLDRSAAVAITDRTDAGWQQVLVGDTFGWVSAQYLSPEKPEPLPQPTPAPETTATPTPTPTTADPAPAPAATPTSPSGASCSTGSGVESGLTGNAIAVHRAVCGRFPQISSYGGYRPGGDSHGSGRALDVMVSGQLGWDVANWLRANAGSLGISEIIYSQTIWTVQRGGEGWRGMSDRGSATANHYDHVHVTVY